jgi:riboflavin transporter FmnP
MGFNMTNTKKIVATAMLIALCVLLPMAFMHVQMAGRVLLPMHIPVLLAGLVCGWKFGLITGLVAPILSSGITSMPPMGIVPIMTIELATYGLVAGIVLQFVRTKRASFDLYIALVAALVAGRVVAGIAEFAYFFSGANFDGVWHDNFSFQLWWGIYFVTAMPGLVLQFAFVPSVVLALERERVIPPRYANV